MKTKQLAVLWNVRKRINCELKKSNKTMTMNKKK